jgi:hypothetical protein
LRGICWRWRNWFGDAGGDEDGSEGVIVVVA